MTEPNGISGSGLKIIAVLSMLTDHVGAILLGSYEVPYYACRIAGRIAFPIFCFLLTEGFFHTKNRSKYFLRLFLFAWISEIPFDLAFSGAVFFPGYQNVFFTLSIGLLTIQGMSLCKERLSSPSARAGCNLAVLAAGMLAAWLLKTDYGEVGVLTIALFYSLHETRVLATGAACLVLCLSNLIEFSACAAIPLVACYSGKRGISLKYAFYVFYPAHLLLLALVSRLL